MPGDKPRTTIPVAEERVRVDRASTETGRVRIRTYAEHEPIDVDLPLMSEKVQVERVPVERVVDEAKGPRTEGELTIIPVYEERVVVDKQLVLVEEVHVRRRRSEQHHREQVDRRKERVDISRDEPGEIEGHEGR